MVVVIAACSRTWFVLRCLLPLALCTQVDYKPGNPGILRKFCATLWKSYNKQERSA